MAYHRSSRRPRPLNPSAARRPPPRPSSPPPPPPPPPPASPPPSPPPPPPPPSSPPPPPPPPDADMLIVDVDKEDEEQRYAADAAQVQAEYAAMASLGLPVEFSSTKGKPVEGANVSGARIIKKRKYRQYMNRKGGFNRPLDGGQ